MKFDPKITKFAGHETFHLRYGWLTKGFRALTKDPKIFEKETATIELGVGKNMVMKRMRARARGRMARILKPFSEIRIVLREREEVK